MLMYTPQNEVKFLLEDSIIEKMKNAIDEKLTSNNASRTFYIQAKLPQVDLTKETVEEILGDTQVDGDKDNSKKINPKNMIWTSSSDQKLDKFNFIFGIADMSCSKLDEIEGNKNNSITDTSKNESHIISEIVSNISMDTSHLNETTAATTETNNQEAAKSKLLIEIVENKSADFKSKEIENTINTSDKIDNTELTQSRTPVEFKSYSVNEIRIEIKLLSVLTLRKEIEESYHEGLRNILSDLIFVGCVDECSALIQSGVNLYICNIQKLAEELFYEIMLYDFANYGVIKFSEPILIKDLAMLGLDCEEAGWTADIGEKEELASRVQELLLEKADMLRQYFSIYIDKKGYLKSLTILLENYFPSQAEIPLNI